mmetsp:Transcript_118033/g.296782  ORF Transcript_118033/g.296782 Transcript_118033/m.296782 type:complete len:490 (-) Transcript_118033:143-1612(-)
MAITCTFGASQLLFVAVLLVGLAAPGWVRAEDALEALASGDECSSEDGVDCALNALQRRGERVSGSASTEQEQQSLEFAAAEAEAEAEAERLLRADAEAEAAAESLRSLLSPRLRYNSSAFGGRRAPAVATQYDGLEDEREFEVQADGDGFTHVFAVGDWGATLPGHYTAPNKRGPGQKCPKNCGYVRGIDDRAQILVANVMKQRAGISNPQYVLNVGDNFYWSGVQENCGSAHADGLTFKNFAEGWQGVYGGLANKPWISCLGNHDYGGWQFNHGWPQQIGYSFVNRNWVMPGRYYSRVMNHPGFSVEYFVIDTNAFDAKSPDDDPEHNICGKMHTPNGATCAAGGGPASLYSCKDWFWQGYNQQKGWLKAKLAASRADWQVVVTHFPCGTDAGFFRMLHHSYGLDLLVTGHRHDQELWSNSGMMGGLTCFVTGGGGGITSEHPPHGMDSSEYGFFDLTMSKAKMHVELVALNGNVIKSSWVYPKSRR